MWISALILFAGVAVASPQVNFPLNSQFPLIARVGSPYSFQFAVTTFQPEPETLEYSLVGNPSWLSLNGKTRTLFGTPTAKDAGTVSFTITAAGEAGAVVNMESKLFVTSSKAPTTKSDAFEQLSSAGQLSGPKTLTFLPSKPFDIDFPPDTFSAVGKDFKYHATLFDHTPLPAWISFDEATMHFAGTTPPMTSSPQAYDLLLIASENPDYAAASIPFTLVVSDHKLLFKPLQQELSIPKGNKVDVSGLRSKLFLDDKAIVQKDIQSASADLPSWLSFDDHTLEITGTPPIGLMSQNVSISVTDRYGDVAEYSIHLLFKLQLFNSAMGTLNITAGQHFEYTIPKTILLDDDEKVSINFKSLSKWLNFDPATLTITGTIPEDIGPRNVEVDMTATSKDAKLEDSQSFHVAVLGSDGSANPVQPGTPDQSNQPERHSKSKAAVIAGSVVGALVTLVILILFACILCRRGKNTRGYISPRVPRSPRKTDISRPIMIHDEWTVDKSLDPDLEKADGDTLLERKPERPPQVDLNLAKEVSQSPASSIGEAESKILSAFDSSSWGFKDEAGPSHQPHDSMRIPTAMARRESDRSDTPTKHRRRITVVYRDSEGSTGLPINRRLTGVGHGRQYGSPSSSTHNMTAYRRPFSCNSCNSTVSTSILSRVPSSVAPNSSLRHTTQLTTPMNKRFSIRMVSKNGYIHEGLEDQQVKDEMRRSRNRRSINENSLADIRTIDEKRQSYIRKRVSAASPFFGATSSRVSSSSYKLPHALTTDNDTASRPAPSPLVITTTSSSHGKTASVFERELPDSLRIRKPSQTPTVEAPEAPKQFPGSLRKHRVSRPFANRYTTSNPLRRRSSTCQSRALELKSSLNSLTGSKVFEDAELSESMYSSEEEEIEDYEKRTTIMPQKFSLSPLDLNCLRIGVQGMKRESRSSQRDSKRASKKISQRDPTPYPRAAEHGGKENQSSTYNLGLMTLPARGKEKAIQYPEGPKTIATTTHRPLRTSIRSGSDSRPLRQSQPKPLSRHPSDRSQTSRPQSRAGGHARSKSRHSFSKRHSRSRTQSSTFPPFDMSTLSETLIDPSKPRSSSQLETSNDTYKSSTLHTSPTATSLLSRDPDGNILNYGIHEDPTIEEVASSSIGFRTSNGQIKSGARQSRLAQKMSKEQSHVSASASTSNCVSKTTHKRETAIRPETYTPTKSNTNPFSIGLGLNLLGSSLRARNDTPGVGSRMSSDFDFGRGARERTPLSVLDDGNGGDPDRLRVVEGKGKRPISVEVDEDLKPGASRKGRTTWGSLRKVVGRGYWEGRGREVKAFL